MPPSYRLPTAQSLGRQSDGEKKVRGLQRREDRHGRGGAVEVVCSTRIKQTELVPCEKSHRSRNLTGTIDFFFFLPPHPPTPVFSASRCLFSKRSNLRGHLRRWAAYTFYPCFFSFFSLPLSHLHIFFFSLSQFPIISARQFCFSSPKTSTLLIPSPLCVSPERRDIVRLSPLSLSLSLIVLAEDL